MDKMCKIYSLSCPINKEIKYIGKTMQELKNRLIGHKVINNYTSSKKEKWVFELQCKNLIPVIELIDECNELDSDDIELYWIRQFRAWGFNLVNTIGVDNKNEINNYLLIKYAETKIYVWDNKMNLLVFKNLNDASSFFEAKPESFFKSIDSKKIYKFRYIVSFSFLSEVDVYDIWIKYNEGKKGDINGTANERMRRKILLEGSIYC